MRILTINNFDAGKRLEEYLKKTDDYFEKLSSEYQKIRTDLLVIFKSSKKYRDEECTKFFEYETDLNFSLKLYEYLNSYSWFNESIASNSSFWSYLCVNVVPDIVFERHGSNPTYYFEKNVRVYLYAMWWYVHMTYQGDIESTKETLKKFNTDTILQIVERPGKDGTYLSISRNIMKYLSRVQLSKLRESIDGKSLHRRILILNTAQMSNFNLIFDGEEELYVKDLFRLCNVNPDVDFSEQSI